MGDDLFSHAGVELPTGEARPGRRRKSVTVTDLPATVPPVPVTPTPAQLAASGRLVGARRYRTPQDTGTRTRIGRARRLDGAEVMPFPLHRNARLLGEVIARLPHGYDDSLNKACAKETRGFENKLVSQGVPQQSAWLCARTLLHHAYMQRVDEAHREAGVL